jgi:effector-binding domain-containing protein
MKKAAAFLVLLVLAGPVLGGEGNDPRAIAVIERAIEAMGGDAALAKVKGFQARYSGTYQMGEMASPYTSEMTLLMPDRLLWSLSTPGFSAKCGVDGETTWSSFMAPPARCRGAMEQAIREWLAHYDLLLLRPLLHREDVKLTLAFTLEEEGKVGEEVTATFPDDFAYTLEFETPVGEDGKRGLTRLVGIRGDMTHMDGRKGRFVSKLSGTKTFGEVTLPVKSEMETYVGERRLDRMTEELTSVEWNPLVEASAFAVPPLAMKLDEMTTKTVPAHSAIVIVHEGDHGKLGEGFARVMTIVGETGLMPMGPVTAVFLNDPAETELVDLRTEIRAPVMLMGPPPAALPEGAEIRSIPAVKVATVTVRAPYGTFEGPKIGALAAWAAEQGLAQAGPPQIAYHHQPEGTVPEDQVAEVQLPVK